MAVITAFENFITLLIRDRCILKTWNHDLGPTFFYNLFLTSDYGNQNSLRTHTS